MNYSLKNTSGQGKKAVMQAGYQLIRSANYDQISEDDDSSVDVIFKYLGCDECMAIGNLLWNIAINFSPYESFKIISAMTKDQKEEFKQMINEIVEIDPSKRVLRRNCAIQLFIYCHVI